jgi:hypothetical protein
VRTADNKFPSHFVFGAVLRGRRLFLLGQMDHRASARSSAFIERAALHSKLFALLRDHRFQR